MINSQSSVRVQGGCHCGAVRFEAIIDQFEAIDCNCSICRKKGFIHLLVPPENFTLIKGEQMLTTYTFNSHTAQHTFCSICGIHSFYHPRSHPGWFDVNVNCLDQVTRSDFEIKSFDGQNWEKNVEKIKQSPSKN
ncbi:GFA family protein [Cyanothece sp. BG0011]|uniref:GFA family protein n=1 Tax=Cyanothece sp. BG0011 TaxID=2082950 RepID=UPI000D1DD749|nr:GFA family protein [Cyanothece sp. BG0011]